VADATSGYVVAVKSSARRLVAPAGEWVSRNGPRRTFETKLLARAWAREIATPEVLVWVQDAHPLDVGAADGYLMARRRGRQRGTGDVDPATPGDQQSLVDDSAGSH